MLLQSRLLEKLAYIIYKLKIRENNDLEISSSQEDYASIMKTIRNKTDSVFDLTKLFHFDSTHIRATVFAEIITVIKFDGLIAKIEDKSFMNKKEVNYMASI